MRAGTPLSKSTFVRNASMELHLKSLMGMSERLLSILMWCKSSEGSAKRLEWQFRFVEAADHSFATVNIASKRYCFLANTQVQR